MSNKNFDPFSPNPRVIKGHRFEVFQTPDNFYYWVTIPNKSTRLFAFNTWSSARAFAIRYSNSHSNAFWLRLWDANPLYHRSVVCSHLKSSDYAL